jgi:transcriptional regulator with XRE-family HTH domain
MNRQPYQTQEFEKASCDLRPSVSYSGILNVDTETTRQFSKRSRGIVPSCEGLKRLQAAIVAAELKENYGNRFTQEELSSRMGVSTKTLSRLWSLTAGLDQRTLKLCFSAFDLQLTTKDYTTLDSSHDSHPDIKAQLSNIQFLDSRPYKYPSGPEPLTSIFYIPRFPIEESAYHEITQPGCLIRIKAAKEMGKSSLMYRILAEGQTLSYQTVNLNINQADASILNNVDKFLRWFCKSVSQQLNLQPKLDDYWDEEMGSKSSCSIYFQEYLLEGLNSPVVLALNEINKIFEYPELAEEFLLLLRSWHELGKYELPWQKLRLVMIYSTEINILLDTNQSSCNVGLLLQLPEFSRSNIQELALRYGFDWRVGNQTEQLIGMVGGHPYLVRIALYHLCSKEVTLSQLLLEASTESGIYAEHLHRLLIALKKKAELLNAFEAVLAADHSIRLEPLLAYKLESMGLVKMNSDGVTISRELYRHYFHKHLFK